VDWFIGDWWTGDWFIGDWWIGDWFIGGLVIGGMVGWCGSVQKSVSTAGCTPGQTHEN